MSKADKYMKIAQMAEIGAFDRLGLILLHSIDEDGYASITQQDLAIRLGCSLRTAQNITTRLRDAGLIERSTDERYGAYRLEPVA